ncbi:MULTISPECIES: SDR family NAD(P)-dependent oxidoreductase [Pseudonocardia]|uniref:Short chain dehydrogenase n=2 Tax=Pseudonocardia TaxID=1847 RepID=A0A1Y2MUN6_PSEAH|nr:MULTISPECIES: SDR family NAD(P)-dependent oxidoreductase [Pseudonocardia]OSY38517.1 short chain dehydrogenase [Pseudonocardia autotrophica]TDN77040.1 short subunit dehydrogenase [Pseudonocardia autotrophica]BBG01046.1 hypothetical protein Pdca_22550 [Pseudonocardia autotrophica]GEC26674.1 hypothetical protein PSA01_37030 [Pseudonocardia saturnea]
MPTALIAGGSRGLGEAYARELAERGYSIVLVARDTDRLAAAAERIGRATGAIVDILAADLTEPAGLAVVERRIADPHLPVRVLVLATRCTPRGPVVAVQPYSRAVQRLIRAAVPVMAGPVTGHPVIGHPAVPVIGPRSAGILLVDSDGDGGGLLPDLDVLRATGVPITTVAVRPGAPDPQMVVRRSLADLARGRTVSGPGRARRVLAGCRESRRAALRLAARLLPDCARGPVGGAVREQTRPSPVPTPFRNSLPPVRSLHVAAPPVLPELPSRPALAPLHRPAQRGPGLPSPGRLGFPAQRRSSFPSPGSPGLPAQPVPSGPRPVQPVVRESVTARQSAG